MFRRKAGRHGIWAQPRSIRARVQVRSEAGAADERTMGAYGAARQGVEEVDGDWEKGGKREKRVAAQTVK